VRRGSLALSGARDDRPRHGRRTPDYRSTIEPNIEEDGRIVGCAAIERYGTAALLRSVAILKSHRGRRIGETLVATVIQNARDRVQAVFLLTTTAADWFPRFGFTAVSRNEVPDSLQGSAEFRGACPASAVVMKLPLR